MSSAMLLDPSSLHELSPAITPHTTYNFQRAFDSTPSLSLLASHHPSLTTLVSVDPLTGAKRGFSRGIHGAHGISHEDGQWRVRRLEKRGRKWSCGSVDHGSERRGEHSHEGIGEVGTTTVHGQDGMNEKEVGEINGHDITTMTMWEEQKTYSFHIDLSIEVDADFIENQGGPERAVEYINLLVSASNLILEHEVDAHLNVIHVEETGETANREHPESNSFNLTHPPPDRYENETNSKDALKLMRLQLGPKSKQRRKRTLHHAILGRYLGGGIAFIDSICDKDWGFGVSSDMSGTLHHVDENVLFDFFVFLHEIGHSLGSGHTFDAYDPPVDVCGPCSTGGNSTLEGLPRVHSGTIMSYCNFCDGGFSNIALTLGGEWNGYHPRSNPANWVNNPFIEGSVSTEPRRVSRMIWETLSSKECVAPPRRVHEEQGCNEDGDCHAVNECSVEACREGVCVVKDVVPDCCGNGVCELGERECVDCGPYYLKPSDCDECFSLDGFMFEVRLDSDAERDVFIDSIGFGHSSPGVKNATVDLFGTRGSYLGLEQSAVEWEHLATVNVSTNLDSKFKEFQVDPSLLLNVGSSHAFYLSSSENIISFGQGVSSTSDEHGVEIYSSRAVSGRFGDGIDGFTLNCRVGYVLNDAVPTDGSLIPDGSHRGGKNIVTWKSTARGEVPVTSAGSNHHLSGVIGIVGTLIMLWRCHYNLINHKFHK